jgi:hypothetical protein
MVRMACDRELWLFRFVAPTERCLFARLVTVQWLESKSPVGTHEKWALNAPMLSMGSTDKFATNTWPESFSRTGSFGACARCQPLVRTKKRAR